VSSTPGNIFSTGASAPRRQREPAYGSSTCRIRSTEARRIRGPSTWPCQTYSRTLVTTPAPTVLPPSRMANRRPSSMAILVFSSSTSIVTLSPGMHISAPPSNLIVPVTSVVRK